MMGRSTHTGRKKYFWQEWG